MADYQLEYRGLLMGLGTNYHVTEITGLEDEEVRIGDAEIPRAGGDIAGLHVPSARIVVLSVAVKGVKGSQALRDDMQALHDAFQHSDSAYQLYYSEPGFTSRRYVWARPVGHASVRTPRQPFLPQYKIRLKLADPRTYSEFANSALIQHYDANGGGSDYDVTEYGREYSVDASNQVTVTNNGNAKAWPIISFYGPTTGTITQVTLTNITTGVTAVFDVAILPGQTLTADMDAIVTVRPSTAYVVRLDGTNKYSGWAQPREPFYLAPGDNVLRFQITGGTSTDGTAAISYRDTWL